MATDKRLSQVSTLTDFDYALIVKGDQVAKASKQQLAELVGNLLYGATNASSLATVVAEQIGSYKTNTVANGERFVTYVTPQFMLAITGASSGSALYLGNINFLSQIINTLDNVSVTINAGNLSIQNDSGGAVRYSILLPS